MLNQKILLPARDKFHSIPLNEIVHFSVSNNFITAHLSTSKEYAWAGSLQKLEYWLKEQYGFSQFCRVNREFLINLNHIESINFARRVLIIRIGSVTMEHEITNKEFLDQLRNRTVVYATKRAFSSKK